MATAGAISSAAFPTYSPPPRITCAAMDGSAGRPMARARGTSKSSLPGIKRKSTRRQSRTLQSVWRARDRARAPEFSTPLYRRFLERERQGPRDIHAVDHRSRNQDRGATLFRRFVNDVHGAQMQRGRIVGIELGR